MIVPTWAKLLTAGVDVQENCLYWTIRAWGNFLTSQNIAHGQAFSFPEIERIMNLQFTREDNGPPMVVSLALIDSGDNTDVVYDFCAINSEWALPCKGSSHPLDFYTKISRVAKTDSRAYGMQLILVDGGKCKDAIAGRMRRENGKGSWMVYQGCDRTYAEQVTAEHKVNVKKASGRTVQEWKPKASHTDNHYLDCEVYAMAAAEAGRNRQPRTPHRRKGIAGLRQRERGFKKKGAPPQWQKADIRQRPSWWRLTTLSSASWSAGNR